MSKKATTQSKPAPVQQQPAKTTSSVSKPAAKDQAPKPTVIKGAFDPSGFAKNGVSEEQVVEIKTAFDLFDTDQGGWIDTKGKFKINLRTQSCHGFTWF